MGVRTILNKPANLGDPDVRLVFFQGDYENSLKRYRDARDWVICTGQASHKDVVGFINRPAHPDCPAECEYAPFELLRDPQWSVTIDIYCATKQALDWVKSLEIPDNSALEVYEAVEKGEMNLAQAEIILTKLHADHPETKRMKPGEVVDFVKTLPHQERASIEKAGDVLAAEVRKAVESLMGRR